MIRGRRPRGEAGSAGRARTVQVGPSGPHLGLPRAAATPWLTEERSSRDRERPRTPTIWLPLCASWGTAEAGWRGCTAAPGVWGPRTQLWGGTLEEAWKGLFLPNVGSENAFPSLWERLGCLSRMPHWLSLKKTKPPPGDVITRPPFEIAAYC